MLKISINIDYVAMSKITFKNTLEFYNDNTSLRLSIINQYCLKVYN